MNVEHFLHSKHCNAGIFAIIEHLRPIAQSELTHLMQRHGTDVISPSLLAQLSVLIGRGGGSEKGARASLPRHSFSSGSLIISSFFWQTSLSARGVRLWRACCFTREHFRQMTHNTFQVTPTNAAWLTRWPDILCRNPQRIVAQLLQSTVHSVCLFVKRGKGDCSVVCCYCSRTVTNSNS